MSTFLRNIPSLNELLDAPPLKQLIETANRQAVVISAKKFLSGLEAEVRSATASVPVPNVRELAGQIARWISEGQPPRPSPIINATGDVLHPDLSSPPLAKETIAAMQVASTGYMRRGGRNDKTSEATQVESLLCELTGAEAALVTHSGASALMLALAGANAKEKIVVARGDIAESARGERISEIASAAGVTLCEVGAANRTTLADFENELHSSGGVCLSVRWADTGEHIALTDLAELARRKGATLIADLGGAPLIDLSKHGPTAVTIGEAAKSHAALVTFNTDSLFGGPAAGVILGKKEALDALRLMPIYSAIGPNSMVLAGLHATLELYRDPNKAIEAIPVLSLLSTSLANLEFRAQRIASQLQTVPQLESVEVSQESALLGGIQSSSQIIPTFCVQILAKNSQSGTIAARLGSGQDRVQVRIRKEYLCIDLRSVFPEQDARIVEAIDSLLVATEN